MNRLLIAIISGFIPLIFLPKLMNSNTSLLLLILAGLLLIGQKFCRPLLSCLLCCLSLSLLSFNWANYQANHYLQQLEPLFDQTFEAVIEVNSLNLDFAEAIVDQQFQRKVVTILKINQHTLSSPLTAVVTVKFDPQQPLWQAGQQWLVTLRTRAYHGQLNEGGFDSQRWAMANQRLLTATVLSQHCVQSRVNLRQRLVNQLQPYLKPLANQGTIIALLFGDRSQLSAAQKQQFMLSGTAHLMAISGLHIMLLASVGWLLGRICMRFLPQRYNSLLIAVASSWLLALIYCWISGMQPPALRAMVGLSFWYLLRLLRLNLSGYQLLLLVMVLLLIWQPLMVLSDSFWLSCYAVACLLVINQWLPLPRQFLGAKRWYWLRLIHLQLCLTILLLPMQILLFQGSNPWSIIANLIAIPLISLFILPALLIAIISSALFEQTLWQWIDNLLSWLDIFLQSSVPYWLALSHHSRLLSLLGIIVLFYWRLQLWRRYKLILLTLIGWMLLPYLTQPAYQWRVDMLDVGHGLAVVIERNQHVILYDTGNLRGQYSAAERQIMPFLRYHNLKLDGMIISHQHQDHIGGLAQLQQHFPAAWLSSSTASLDNDFACIQGQKWQWQGLNFEVLWPPQLAEPSENRDSCVLRVSDGRFALLLTGDLPQAQETELLKQSPHVAATILQIPHHGSAGSSAWHFLARVNPELAINSVARYNPWHLPAEKTMQRYQQLNITTLSTALHGQISLFFFNNQWQVKGYRSDLLPRWYHVWFGALPNYR